jgi:hypothetical protein
VRKFALEEGTLHSDVSSLIKAVTTGTTNSSPSRLLALVGLLALGGLPTFIIAVVLGSIGVSFVASGVAVFVAGMMAAGGFFSMDQHPIYAILVGPPLAGAGVMALALLVGYFWVAVKVTRKVLAA